uniref:Ankyrin repeat domain-containing protein 24-like n=1 Tax=Petromyzon marinus TaxID=7757 RepID=A0AAJ7U8D1_PETMA|nr:ankyrin repeat domain-containing protein 24-like [Petromyzon marinus]
MRLPIFRLPPLRFVSTPLASLRLFRSLLPSSRSTEFALAAAAAATLRCAIRGSDAGGSEVGGATPGQGSEVAGEVAAAGPPARPSEATSRCALAPAPAQEEEEEEQEASRPPPLVAVAALVDKCVGTDPVVATEGTRRRHAPAHGEPVDGCEEEDEEERENETEENEVEEEEGGKAAVAGRRGRPGGDDEDGGDEEESGATGRQRFSDLERRFSELSDGYRRAREERAASAAEARSLRSELASLGERLGEARAEADRLRAELSDGRQSGRDGGRTLERATALLGERDVALAAGEDVARRLSARVQELEAEPLRRTAREEAAAAAAKAAAEGKSQAKGASELERLEKTRVALEAEVETLGRKLSVLSANHEKTSSEVFRVQREALYMKTERDAALAHADAAQRRMAALLARAEPSPSPSSSSSSSAARRTDSRSVTFHEPPAPAKGSGGTRGDAAREKDGRIKELQEEVNELRRTLRGVVPPTAATAATGATPPPPRRSGDPSREGRPGRQVAELLAQIGQLRRQKEEEERVHKEVVDTYRAHLMCAVQGCMDEDVYSSLVHIVRMSRPSTPVHRP